jgi:predicted flap endonuclease-1-like 5' DNA nuclease
MLAAERERSVRLVRRASVEGGGEVERAVAAVTRPLRDTIARLESELEARAAVPPPVEPVDVTLIRGIGPRIAGILAANGITSLRRIAAFTPDDVARIGPLLPVYPGRIADDRWIEQARELLGGAG